MTTPTDAQPKKYFPLRITWWMYSLVGLLLLLLICWYGAYRTLYRPIRLPQPQTVQITPQSSLAYVAERLQRRGIIPNAFALKLYARLTGRANRLKVGEYRVTAGMRPVDVLDLLISGHTIAYTLTIPEGKWASEISTRIAAHWPSAVPEFNTLVNDPSYWNAKHIVPFQIRGATLEGYLFPDTYSFETNATGEQMITAMLKRFAATCWKSYHDNPPSDGRTLGDVVILASLVESEARRDSERATIAGVYMNRLNTPGWTLDCDATLIYAKNERVHRVLNQDKLIDSPYNTYKNHGLPPGPINNPGLKAFDAALHPAKVTFFFYVAKGDGSHAFANTLAEQTANIHRYQSGG